jgi:hypothetical protein
MSTLHKKVSLAVAIALGAPAAVGAKDLGFTYLEGGIFGGFVNDVEKSGRFTGPGLRPKLETDAGGGGFIAGAWQFRENLHLFGEYATASQELEVRDGLNTVSGDYDLVRWRIGVGYAYPYSQTLGFYGRLSFDHAELKNARVAGFNLNAKGDGLGGEVGMVWAATPVVQVQGHLRYTAAGKVPTDGSDTLDPDILVGLNVRWSFRPDIALVGGYELGKITTLNVGLRVSF